MSENNVSVSYVSTYETAREMAKCVSFVGWLVLGISVFIAITTGVAQMESRYGFKWFTLIPSLVGAVSGLIVVVIGQFARAAVDTADFTGEMLAIMKANTASVIKPPVKSAPEKPTLEDEAGEAREDTE